MGEGSAPLVYRSNPNMPLDFIKSGKDNNNLVVSEGFLNRFKVKFSKN